MEVSIGNAKIVIRTHGCIDCGRFWGEGFTVAREVRVTVGTRSGIVQVYRCAWCSERAAGRAGGNEASHGSDAQSSRGG